MCAPSPPPPPDYAGAAAAQGAANRDTAIAQGHINNPNVVNPYGRQTVTWDGETPTITQELSPEQQQLLDARNANQIDLSGLAGQGIGSLRGLIGTQLNFGDLPGRPTAFGYPSSYTSGAPAPSGNPIARPKIMGSEVPMAPTMYAKSTPGGSDQVTAGAPKILTAAPGATAAAPSSGAGPYSWGNFVPGTKFGSLTDALASISKAHPELAGQQVNLNDPTKFPELFQDGNYIGPNPASNYQGDATYNEDPNFAERMARGGRSATEQADFLKSAGKPTNFTGPLNGFYFVNGRPLPGGQSEFDNFFNMQLPGLDGSTSAPQFPGQPNPPPDAGGAPSGGNPAGPGGNPIARPPGLPPITGGGPPPSGNPGGNPGAGPNYGDLQLPQVQDVPSPLNPNTLPAMPGSAEQVRQNVIDAMMSRTNADLAKRQQALNSDLIARGIRPGTEAYQREMDLLERSRNDARQQAEIAGGNAAAQQFGLDLSRRQQAQGEQGQSFGQGITAGGQKFSQQGQRAQLGAQFQQQGYTQQGQNRRDAIAELLAQRQTPLNEITALMGGTGVSNPFTVPGYAQNTSVAPPPIFGATQAQANAANNIYNAQTGMFNSGLSGLANLGGAALGAFF